MCVRANVCVYVAHVLTNGPAPETPGAYVFYSVASVTLCRCATWRAARVVRNTTNAYVYSPVSS